jgi:hypothetical protein
MSKGITLKEVVHLRSGPMRHSTASNFLERASRHPLAELARALYL